MKKYFLSLLILVSIGANKKANAQINMDTVYVRNLAMEAKDWNYFNGHFENYKKDSTERKLFKRILTAVGGKSNSTIVTIDSIPGKWTIRMVELLYAGTGGEYAKAGGDAIITNLKTKAQLTTKINDMLDPYNNIYQGFRDLGKEWADNH